MPIRTFRLAQEKDEQGNPEEFTSDSFLVLASSKTAHLQSNGLPRKGTRISPGMVLVGKFGAKSTYSKDRLPSDLETLTMTEEELISKYGHMLYDACLYAPDDVDGIVREAYFIEEDGRQIAIVEIETH